jgi:uncharacterized RDD family membrane protein YckC
MHDSLKFETPENVEVQFQLAGLGGRFIAWFLDQFLIAVGLFCFVILLALLGTSIATALEWVDEQLTTEEFDPETVGAYVIGLMFLALGLGGTVYYTLFELFMRGQTPGKWACSIRVTTMNGFTLDVGSILLRNIFRLIDSFPVLWVVPLFSRRGQRLGDMVAGTVVISAETPQLSGVRDQLSQRTAVDAEYRFDGSALSQLTPTDRTAVEQLLERWNGIPEDQRQKLAQQLSEGLALKMKVPAPLPERRLRFLEDLFAAVLRRQNRRLG